MLLKNKQMKLYRILFLLCLALSACKTSSENNGTEANSDNYISDFTIAFGSCNNQFIENPFWDEIKKNNPDVWIWGGDIIYSDTYDMAVLENNYKKLKTNKAYSEFASEIEILATWDDHDYGINDGGIEYSEKEASKQLFLDFLDIPENSSRRIQEGVFFAKDFVINDNSIKIIILDTRYFRTSLTKDTNSNKRYKPNNYGEGSILGETQWNWLKKELESSKASFNIIISSIQVLSGEHGWETWQNMPHEIDKLTDLIKSTQVKNTIILSGDRHISDFSKIDIEGLSYPIIDFTSSGLTHSATVNKGEPNKYRVGNLVNQTSFGILKFNFKENSVLLEMHGKNNTIQQSYTQQYN